jgi:hypothetical protein
MTPIRPDQDTRRRLSHRRSIEATRRAGPEEETLPTIPISFSGSRLEINAQTRPQGTIKVELLDALGHPISGMEPSQAFTGELLRQVISFPGDPDLALLTGRPVVLRFSLRETSLCSFAFRR